MTTGCADATLCTFTELTGGGTITVNGVKYFDFAKPMMSPTVMEQDDLGILDPIDLSNILIGAATGGGIHFDLDGDMDGDGELDVIGLVSSPSGQSVRSFVELDFSYQVMAAVMMLTKSELSLNEFNVKSDPGTLKVMQTVFDSSSVELLALELMVDDVKSPPVATMGTMIGQPGVTVEIRITNDGGGEFESENIFTSMSQAFFPDDPTAVPEPTTLALVGLGLWGIAASHRRRRK